MSEAKLNQRAQPAVELMGSLGFLLNRTAQHFHDQGTAVLAPLGLSGRAYGLLRVVGAREPLTQCGLGQLVGVDRSSMVLLVDALEKEGLVERQAAPGDRRSHAVAITAKGRRVLAQAQEQLKAVEVRFLESLKPAEQKALRENLARLALAHHPQPAPNEEEA